MLISTKFFLVSGFPRHYLSNISRLTSPDRHHQFFLRKLNHCQFYAVDLLQHFRRKFSPVISTDQRTIFQTDKIVSIESGDIRIVENGDNSDLLADQFADNSMTFAW